MLIIIPNSRGGHCGLTDHAGVVQAELNRIGVDAKIQLWPPRLSGQLHTPILLEFTPLAYSRIGLSWPLLLQVMRWRWQGSRVITYFHELPFPNGRGWKRQLAVALQRAYCMLLAAASAHSLVNQQQERRWLQLSCGCHRLSFLPTCSNVGESDAAANPANRLLQVVVFGSPGKRRHAHALVASQGGYRRLFGSNVSVIDIGEPMPLPHQLISEVTLLGSLPSVEIQEHLLASRYGFFYAEPDQFSKSGVFAAYCANGVVPILAHSAPDQPAYYLTPEEIAAESQRFLNPEAVWRSCRHWYRQFSTSACAHRIYELAYES